ncbi:MAG: beta-propeller fold lactonase family protein [Methylomicrobium sp.]|nr:beta-propeller fold lactonase family protein [Methylomicrobium sp.]
MLLFFAALGCVDSYALAATESRPTDLAVSPDGHMLYVLSNGDHSIGVYNIQRDGKLSKREAINALPAGLTGLVVR